MNIALITARGGSKGLPRKNIRTLNDMPLIYWTIEAALLTKEIDYVYVSTDDEEIKKISLESGALCIDRPAILSTDTATSESVIKHAIEYFHTINLNVHTIILLQPTSPLRNKFHIEEALRKYESSEANMVLSVYEPKHTPIKAFFLNKGNYLEAIYDRDAPFSRRQDLPKAFQSNGAIYIFSVEQFNKNRKLPRENLLPYIMTEQDSEDIDTIEDLKRIERLYKDKK